MTAPLTRAERIAALHAAAKDRILVLDGSWGVMIQRRGLDEADFLGERFVGHPGQMKGNNDILCITRPDVITDLHDQYYAAGADISETNTFSATVIAQEDYHLDAEAVWDINLEGARLARASADRWTEKEPHKPRFVAGAIGPLNKMLSMSSDVNDPGARLVTFDQVYEAYRHQVEALHQGGVDLYLIETITDRSGRTLSGQTAEAFWNSVKHAKPFAIGFNCALGADLMRPHIAELSRIADTLVAAYPNAGLPNAMGQYDEQPHETAHFIEEWARSGLVNIVGGCCGTTPEHIQHVAQEVAGLPPRTVPDRPVAMRLSGLEPFELIA